LARENGWWDVIIGPMQGLRVLYEHTGRATEWRRLVAELIPDLADPQTDGPLPGREQQWAMHTEYQITHSVVGKSLGSLDLSPTYGSTIAERPESP
jgi:hypothetical protein